jgi:bacterioferritin-associated ferredoxin
VYACICHAVTDREVVHHVETGADSVEGIGERCNAGTGCGTCHERLERLIEQHSDVRPCVLASLAG